MITRTVPRQCTSMIMTVPRYADAILTIPHSPQDTGLCKEPLGIAVQPVNPTLDLC